MITLDAHLMSLYENGLITYEDLVTKSQDPDSIVQKLQDEAGKRRK
jgi:Tfp pilus assembly ATPase PilU